MIGRYPHCEIVINDTSVSKQHCQIINGWLQDLESTNGTKLNGQLIPHDRKIQIKHNDVILLGDAEFQVVEGYKKDLKIEQEFLRSKRFGKSLDRNDFQHKNKLISSYNNNGQLIQSINDKKKKAEEEEEEDLEEQKKK